LKSEPEVKLFGPGPRTRGGEESQSCSKRKEMKNLQKNKKTVENNREKEKKKRELKKEERRKEKVNPNKEPQGVHSLTWGRAWPWRVTGPTLKRMGQKKMTKGKGGLKRKKNNRRLGKKNLLEYE